MPNASEPSTPRTASFRMRCVSVYSDVCDQFEDNNKDVCTEHPNCQIELRSRPISTGPIVIAASATGGFRAEVRFLADLHVCKKDWCNSSYEWHLRNIRPLRHDLVKIACVNCRSGIRDTHAGIYNVEVQFTAPRAIGEAAPIQERNAPEQVELKFTPKAPPAKTRALSPDFKPAKPLSYASAPREPIACAFHAPSAPSSRAATPQVARRAEPITQRVEPIAKAGAQITKPTPLAAVKQTALRPADPFTIGVPSELERAIAEFGDTEEVRSLFGGSK